MISDLHCEKNPNAFEWLKHIIEDTSPDLLFAAGDWGECKEYPQILPKERVITVYGNHDNVTELREKFTLLDGDVVEINGIRVGGVSGIISPKGTPTKTGVPRKTPGQFLIKASKIKDATDIMIMHETPYIPEVFGRMWRSAGSLTALKALSLVKPKMLLVGHMHLAPALHAELEDGMRIVHVDSSQKGYVIWDLESGTLTGYSDRVKMFEVHFDLLELPMTK